MTIQHIKTKDSYGYTIESYYADGILHREDGPAFITYRPDGSVAVEKFFFNGKLHRNNGPAFITHVKGSGSIKRYFKNGVEILKKKTRPRGNKNTPDYFCCSL